MKQCALMFLFFLSHTVVALNIGKLAITRAVLVNSTDQSISLMVYCHDQKTQALTRQPITIPAQREISREFPAPITALLNQQEQPIEPDSLVRDVAARKFHIFFSRPPQAPLPRFFIPPYHSFETSMGPYFAQCSNARSGKYLTATKPAPAQVLLSFFAQLYEANHPTKITIEAQARIPKTIHQIWLGSKLPARFKRWQQAWLDQHPNWQFILWTDQEVVHNESFLAQYSNYEERSIQDLGPLTNETMYHQAPNFGAKADILRIEILYRFGGLYTDVDVECCEPFDLFHHCYDFYAGIEPLEFLWLSLNNGIIGSIAGHPILARYIQDIGQKRTFPRAWQSTHLTSGPIAFTQAFWASAPEDKEHRNIVFPARYFGPIDRFNNITMRHETYAKQYFTHSWIR